MKRLLLFLALACGGLLGLTMLAGGFYGRGQNVPKPELPLVPDAAPTEAGPASVRIADFPMKDRGTKPPNFELKQASLVSVPILRERTWVDPITRERIEFPFFHELSYTVAKPVPTRDRVTGTPGGAWEGWHLIVYREVGSLTRKEAEALQASPLSRQQLVLYDITAAQGEASFPLVPVADEQHAAGVRTLIHLTKDVVIRIVPDGTVIRTSDVTIDKDAGIASGSGLIDAENAAWKLHGKGFRLEKTARRMEILEGVTLDARRLSDDADALQVTDLASGPFRPKTLSCHGRAVVARLDEGDGNQSYEIALSERVHLEAEDTSVLDADQVVVLATRLPPRRAGSDGPATADAARFKLARMTATGNVEVVSHEAFQVEGRASPVLSIATPKMTCRFDGGRFESALLEGTTVVRYLGQLDLPGGRGRLGSVIATCRERLSYGPRSALAPEIPPCDAVLELAGKAEVEGAAQEGEEAQRLQADRLLVYLKRQTATSHRAKGAKADAPPSAAATGPANARDEFEVSRMQASGFVATGGDVRITGPRLAASAREMKGYDLDKDAWRVLASGPDVRLEVASDSMGAPSSPKGRPGAASQGLAKAPAAPKSWALDDMDAQGDVTGSLRPQTGDGALTFSGATLTYAVATGGVLLGSTGHVATVGRPRPDGKDDLIEAPRITFGVDGDERSLTASGGVHALVWTLPAAATSTSPAPTRGGRRMIAISSGSRLEFDGQRGGGVKNQEIVVRAHDGATVEAREGGLVSDRVAAREFTARLSERTGPGSPDLLGAPRDHPTTPLATPAPAPAHGPARVKAGTASAAARWTVTCEALVVRFAATANERTAMGGLRRLEANGGVDARSEGSGGATERQHFEGAHLLVDGVAAKGTLSGSASARARVTLGDEDLPQRLVSPLIDFTLEQGTLSQATFHAPVAGVFHTDGSAGGATPLPGAASGPKPTKGKRTAADEMTRYVLQSDAGDLVIDATGAIVEGADDRQVVVTRSTRPRGATAFERGMKLSARKLTLVSAGGLGSGKMALERLVAEGRNTLVELGEPGKNYTRALGDHIEYVAATSKIRLTGTDGVTLTKPGGYQGKVRAFTIDTRTNTPDIEGIDFTLELTK